MDTSKISELLEILEKEANVYSDILDISKNKTNVVVEGKVAELESIVKLEQSLIMKLRKLEDHREKLIGSISAEIGAHPSKMTVSELANLLGSEQSERLKNAQNSLKGTIDRLQNTNELNSRLINNSLEYIEFSINLLTAAGALNNSYGSNGRTDDGKKKNFFDVKL